MSLLTGAKALSPRWLLASAAFLLHSGGALAADFAGDAQRQARDLLTGSSTSLSTVTASNAHPEREAQAAILDPQAQARDVIEGSRNRVVKSLPATVPETKTSSSRRSARARRYANADPQTQAQRMLLGTAANHRWPTYVSSFSKSH